MMIQRMTHLLCVFVGVGCLGKRSATLHSRSCYRKARKYCAKCSALLILRLRKEGDYKRSWLCRSTSFRRYSWAAAISPSEYSLNWATSRPCSCPYLWLPLPSLPPSSRPHTDRLLLCGAPTNYYHSSLAMLDRDRLELQPRLILMHRFSVFDRCFWKLCMEEGFFLAQEGSSAELLPLLASSGLGRQFGPVFKF